MSLYFNIQRDGSLEYLLKSLYNLNAFVCDVGVLTKISQTHTHSDTYVHDAIITDQGHITLGVLNETFNFQKLFVTYTNGHVF